MVRQWADAGSAILLHLRARRPRRAPARTQLRRAGESYGNERAHAVRTGGEPHVRIMALRDFAHDRQPQAAAFGAGPEHAMKALEHALVLVGRHARPVVLDG